MRLYDELVANAPEGTIRDQWSASTLIVADNVITAIDEAPDYQFFKDAGDFILAPPFMDFVIEGRSALSGGTILVQVEVVEPDAARSVIKLYRWDGCKVPSDAKWVYMMRCFAKPKNAPGIVAFPATIIIPVAGTGRAYQNGYDVGFTPQDKLFFAQSKVAQDSIIDPVSNGASFACYTISLMNCRNVERIDVPLSRPQRRRNAAGRGTPEHSYYVLRVKRTKRQQAAVDRELPGELAHKRREHLRHGHFKTYTADAPLFGKYVGSWYWEPIQVGDPGLGTIDKDYDIEF